MKEMHFVYSVSVAFLIILYSNFSYAKIYDDTLVVNKIKRSFRVYLPDTYQKKFPTPLVIVLHGTGKSKEQVEILTGMSLKAEKEKFIVLYPDAIGSPRSWDVVIDNENNNDIMFIKGLIKLIQRQYNIDSRRIYVTGHSNGAMMAYKIVIEVPDTVAAMAAVNGTIVNNGMQSSQSNDSKTSIFIINGRKDPIVLPGGKVQKDSTYWWPIDKTVNYWVQAKKCKTSESTVSQLYKNRVLSTTYFSCLGGSVVTYYDIMNGKHIWPGGRTLNGYVNNPIFDATEIIWDFFQKHPKPD